MEQHLLDEELKYLNTLRLAAREVYFRSTTGERQASRWMAYCYAAAHAIRADVRTEHPQFNMLTAAAWVVLTNGTPEAGEITSLDVPAYRITRFYTSVKNGVFPSFHNEEDMETSLIRNSPHSRRAEARLVA